MGLNFLISESAQAALKATVRTLGDFDLRQLFQQLARRPALLGRVGQHVVQLRGHGGKADPLQLLAQVRLFGFGVFVVSLGEFIVGLQIVRSDFDTSACGWRLRSSGNGAVRWDWRSRNSTEAARGVLRSRASRTAPRMAPAP